MALELNDARSMRAVAHPVRLALIEALAADGPMTATEAGRAIGETATTCSFHLRQLARYHFVEEAGGGPGRARPWRLTHVGMRFGRSDEPEAAAAADALDEMLRGRYLARLEAYHAGRDAYPKRWRDVSGVGQDILQLTPDDLRELDEEVKAVFARFRARGRRPGALPVEVIVAAYPMRPPGPETPA